MFAIEVEYLLGRAVATDASQRDRAEWPPHPQRLFSALVDAHHADASPAGEAALRWLEAAGSPSLRVAHRENVDFWRRDIGKHWVPINDELPSGEKNLRAAPLPQQRRRQERYFPAVTLSDACVQFIWSTDPAHDTLATIAGLTHRLCYLGHSASPIRATVLSTPAAPTLSPSADADALPLRVPGPGRFDRLNAVHQLRLTNESHQPPLGVTVRYAERQAPAVNGPLEAVARLKIIGGPRLGLEASVPLMRKLRAALLSIFQTPQPEVLSGHTDDAEKALGPHLALHPLAHIDHRYADGSLKGFMALLPRDASDEVRVRLKRAFAALAALKLGAYGELVLALVEPDESLVSLALGRYVKAADQWVTVTPIALGRHPKKRQPLEAVIAHDVQTAGLPPLQSVELSEVSFLPGAPHARAFHRDGLKQLDGRILRHARLRFAEPVRGPVVIGAGRFIGLGLCRAEAT
jgi:CRISPR-associated protein Csb2